MTEKLELSTSAVLRTISILFLSVFLFLIRDILLLLFIALILVSALTPIVNWFERRKIPRLLGTLLIYLFGLVILGLLIYLIIPPLVSQLSELSSQLPDYLAYLNIRLDKENLQQYIQGILKAGNGILARTRGVVGSLISLMVVLVISFYLLVDKDGIKRFLRSVMPTKYQSYALSLWSRIQKKMGHWLLGQVFLCFVVGVLVFIGLSVLGVRYALALAILAGALEIVPYIGPTISVIPAVIVGFLQAPIIGLLVLALYILVQQIENHVIVPQVMGRVVGLNPVVVILALLVGAKLAGALGALLAVPAAAALSVFIKDVMNGRQDKKEA
jgi:predicted PurR-regulated permease PerM